MFCRVRLYGVGTEETGVLVGSPGLNTCARVHLSSEHLLLFQLRHTSLPSCVRTSTWGKWRRAVLCFFAGPPDIMVF